MGGEGCRFGYRFYDAKLADEKARRIKSKARRGIDCTPEILEEAVKLVKPLLKKGQGLDHIWSAHEHELPCSKRTFYRYIDMGAMDILNIELPKKVAYKVRRKSVDLLVPRQSMKGRTFDDFKELPLETQLSAVQMDCVEGRYYEKQAILTLHFRRYCFQIMMLLPEKTQKSVAHALDLIEGLCGEEFSQHFGVILTDRGSEFLDSERIETSRNGTPRCKVYYCDPLQSGQKGSCENNHRELRKILPKGTSFVNLTPRNVALACSHVNSYARPSLGGVAPLTLASRVLPADLIDGLGIELIPPDDVILKPRLINL